MASGIGFVALLVVLLAAGEAGAAQLTASWVDNSGGVATTRLERRLGTEAVYTAYVDVPPGMTSYADSTVSAGTTYCYRAMAYNADGASAYSEEACAAAPSDTYLSVTVSKSGTGSGTVTSSPAGIDCGSGCSADFIAGTVVTLAATAASGSTFDGWSGGVCTGTDPCTFTGNGAATIGASFSLVPVTASPSPTSYTLTVAKSGPGTVASAPSGISCGSDCSEAYVSGTTVTLTATPNKNGASFTGWSGGGCSGTSPTCTVSMTADRSVSAAFRNGRGK
jgi:hypothetical protein